MRKDIREYSYAAIHANNEQARKVYEQQLGGLATEELLLAEKLTDPKIKQIDFGTAVDMVFDYLKALTANGVRAI